MDFRTTDFRTTFKTATFILFFAMCASAKPKGAVALIPGTLNSVVPYNYFSETIVRTLENQGFTVKIMTDLDPVGQFESNGHQTVRTLREWYFSKFPTAEVPLTLIGHSAGGFYSLYAATVARDLPIKKIILYSTPLEGSRLADRTLPEDLEFANRTGFFDFRGLPQLRTENVKKFLMTIRLDPSVKLYAVGGSQPSPALFDNRLNARYLSVAMTMTGKIIGSESDGIIERSSSYGVNSVILSDAGAAMSIKRLTDLHAVLEHPEQVIDYKFFLLGATMNTGFIDEGQRQLFTSLGKIIELY